MRDVVICIPGITGSVLQEGRPRCLERLRWCAMNALTHARPEHRRPEARGGSTRRGRPRRRGHGARGDPRRPPDPWPLEDRRLHEDAAVHRGDLRRHARREPLRVPVRLASRQPRRGAPPAAAGQAMAEGLARVERRSDAKLVLVGHSMGGLISRYFLECLEGWRDTRTLVTFGTPVPRLAERARHARERQEDRFFDLTERRAILHGDLPVAPDVPLLRRREGNPGVRRPSADIPTWTGRRRRRRSTSTARSRPLSRRTCKDPAYADGGYGLARIVGVKQPTRQSAVRDGDGVKLLRTIDGQDPGGDGTVPRPSATPLEYETTKARPSRRNGMPRCRTTITCCYS